MKREKHLERALKVCKRELQIFIGVHDEKEIKDSFMGMIEAIEKANKALARKDE